jgi:O-antigen ligase
MIFWEWSNDPFLLPKLLIAVPIGIFLLISAYQVFWLKRNKYGLMFTTFVIILFISNLIITSGNFNEKFYGYFTRNNGFLTYLALVGLFLGSYISFNTINFDKIIRIGKITLLACLFIGYLQFFQINLGNLNPNNFVIGPFGNPNFQSAFLGMISACVLVEVIRTNKSPNKLIINLIIIAVTVHQIIISGSIQGFFLVVFNIFLFTIYILRKRNLKKYFYLVVYFSILGIFFGLLGLANKGPLAKYLFEPSIADRFFCWQAGFKILQNYPIVGVGFEQYRHFYPKNRSPSSVEIQSLNYICDTSHNVFIDIGSNLGIIFLLIYSLIIALIIFRIIRAFQNLEELPLNKMTLIAVWSSYQIQSIISINHIGLAVWGWILSGLLLADRKNSNFQFTQDRKFRRNSSRTLLFSIFIGLMILIPIFNKYQGFYLAAQRADSFELNQIALRYPLTMPFLFAAGNNSKSIGDEVSSIKIARVATANFPNSIDAWKLLLNSEFASSEEKTKARLKLTLLDPYSFMNPKE